MNTDQCPTCGLVVIGPDVPVGVLTCNPLRSPGCWTVVGKSKNGSPILRVIEGGKS